LEKAIAMQPGMACHQLLAVILLTDEVAEPYLLWDQFKAGLCDDVKHKLHHMNYYQADQKIPEDDVLLMLDHKGLRVPHCIVYTTYTIFIWSMY